MIVGGMIEIEMQEHAMVEQERGCAPRSLQVETREDARKGELRRGRGHCGAVLAEAPKRSSRSGTSSSLELSISLLCLRLQIILCHLLLLCTLTHFIPSPAHA